MKPRLIPKPLIFALLFSVFLGCFVVTPLWNLMPGAAFKAGFLAATLVAGFLWAWWGSGAAWPEAPSPRSFTAAGGLSLLMFVMLVTALYFPSLTQSIAWRGDEDQHVSFPSQLAAVLPRHMADLGLLAGFLAWSARRAVRGRSLFIVAAAVGLLAAYAGRSAHFEIYQVLRFPIFLKYLTAMIVYAASFLPAGPFPEIPYRILPLLSAAGLAWLGFRFLDRHPLSIRIGAALAIVSLPLVRYYGTIFYLEMPAVFCMTLVCFQAIPLLRAVPLSLTRYPGWFALLALGFIKETTLPFLAAYCCCRFCSRIRSLLAQRKSWRLWFQEALVFFCVCFPLFLYLCFRMHVVTTRSYHPDVSNLANIAYLRIMVRSCWDSFGLLLPLAALGAVLLAYRRKWVPLVFSLLAFTLVFLFHFLDGGLYLGYSRFNLFLLPSLVALAWEALRLGAARFRALAIAALALLVGTNAILSPIHADGSRKPLWGIYASDIGDHSYPYREAFVWIKAHQAGKKVRLTGLYYPYPLDFYFPPEVTPTLTFVPKPAPGGEPGLLDSMLAVSAAEGYAAVLYHVVEGSDPAFQGAHGFADVKVFRNQAHALVLFSR